MSPYEWDKILSGSRVGQNKLPNEQNKVILELYEKDKLKKETN